MRHRPVIIVPPKTEDEDTKPSFMKEFERKKRVQTRGTRVKCETIRMLNSFSIRGQQHWVISLVFWKYQAVRQRRAGFTLTLKYEGIRRFGGRLVF